MSLAIFISVTATPRSAAIAATIASSEPCAANLFGAVSKGRSGQLRDLRGDLLGEAGRGVEPRADGRPSGGEAIEPRHAPPHVLGRVAELRRPARPLVADRERDRVLEMRPANLHDVLPGVGLRLDGAGQLLEARQEVPIELEDGGDVHRGREGVVRRLRHVDVVVRVNRRLAPELPAEELDGAVRDDLVHVHVRLRSRSRLPHVERELAVELSGDDLVGDRADGLRLRTPAVDPRPALTRAAAFFT